MGINWSAMLIEPDRVGILVGTWVTALTWGIMLMQLIGYIRAWENDSRILRGAVLFLFGSETTISILTFIGAHKHLINTPRGTMASFSVPVISSSTGFLNGFTMTGVNWFLLWRFHRLTSNWWISVPLFMFTLASFACVEWSAQLGALAIDSVMAHPENVKGIMTRVALGLRVAYGLEVFIVTATVAALITELTRRTRDELLSGKQREGASHQAHSGKAVLTFPLPPYIRIVKRLIVINLGSGALTAALTIVTFVEIMRNVASNILIYANCVSRSYFMAMLFNLAMRKSDALKRKEPTLSHVTTSLATGSRGLAERSYQARSFGEAHDQDIEIEAEASSIGKQREQKYEKESSISFPPSVYNSRA